MIFQLKKKSKRRAVVLGVPSLEESSDPESGPTCLAQVYRLYRLERSRAALVEATPRATDRGPFAAQLGLTALRDGFGCEMYCWNLRVLDPTWRDLSRAELTEKLHARREVASDEPLRQLIRAYIEFVEKGGNLRYREPTRELITDLLHRDLPVIVRVNVTHLYGTPRELAGEYDDIRGESVSRFVVVSGYFPKSGRFIVRDSSPRVPTRRLGRYSARWDRFISATLCDHAIDAAALIAVTPN